MRLCEACECGDHANCGMQTWCDCDCDPEQVYDLTLIQCAPLRCADGEHKFDGPDVPVSGDAERPMGYTTTCSKCGARAIDVHLWMLP